MVYVVSGVLTVLMALAGLVVTCRLERRALAARRKGRRMAAGANTRAA
jgi:hypothetical protein